MEGKGLIAGFLGLNAGISYRDDCIFSRLFSLPVKFRERCRQKMAGYFVNGMEVIIVNDSCDYLYSSIR